MLVGTRTMVINSHTHTVVIGTLSLESTGNQVGVFFWVVSSVEPTMRARYGS